MRIALEIAYVGTNYNGWQAQKNKSELNCIQTIIEKAFKEKLNIDVNLIASGRTDTGVHAYKQIAHFDTTLKIEPKRYCKILNFMLPPDVRIMNSYKVDDNFNARFDAKKKTYEYKIYYSEIENPFLKDRALCITKKLDIENMKKVATVLIGEHDFTSFCKKSSSDKNCIRTIYNILFEEKNNNVSILVTGNGFLHNMVRIIVGTLISAGTNETTAKDVLKILNNKDRTTNFKTAPPYALYLKNVEYV